MLLDLFLKIKRNRRVYVSADNNDVCKKVLFKLKQKYKVRIMVTVQDSVEPGNLVYESMKHQIAKCNFCFVLIAENLSSFQKKEIKEMKKQKKRIVPILLSDETVLPTILSDISPLKYDDL